MDLAKQVIWFSEVKNIYDCIVSCKQLYIVESGVWLRVKYSKIKINAVITFGSYQSPLMTLHLWVSRWKKIERYNGILSNQMKFCRQIFYLSKGLFAPGRVRLQILKAAFRIHSCSFGQQRSSPTIHKTHFNLLAFHSQQHYFLFTRFSIAYSKIIYLLL